MNTYEDYKKWEMSVIHKFGLAIGGTGAQNMTPEQFYFDLQKHPGAMSLYEKLFEIVVDEVDRALCDKP